MHVSLTHVRILTYGYRLLLLGFGLVAFAVLLIDLGFRQCQAEGFVGPCPESYYGLSVFITLTLGLVAIAISVSSRRATKMPTERSR